MLSLVCAALAQQRDETVLRHRLAEQEALTEVAAHADQSECIGGFFDAHGDRGASEIMRQIDHRLAERRIDPVGAAIGDKGVLAGDCRTTQLCQSPAATVCRSTLGSPMTAAGVSPANLP